MNLQAKPSLRTPQVAGLVGEVEQAWNTHDMARFAACFAEDADFVNVRGWWWEGA